MIVLMMGLFLGYAHITERGCDLPSVQTADASGNVTVIGAVARPLNVSSFNASKYDPVRATVRQPSQAGAISGDFSGISISALLVAAGARTAPDKAGLDGAVLLATARDGYTVSLSFSEIDPSRSVAPAFLAFWCNGQPISPTLVVPGDRLSKRYVHELTSLRFISTVNAE